MYRKLLLIIVCHYYIGLSFSQDTIILKDNLYREKIGRNLYYFIDNSKSITFEEVSSPEFHNNFITSKKAIPFFDYKSCTVWFKFSIRNSAASNKKFFLLIDYPLLYRIRVFVPNQNGIDTLYSGDGYKFNKRSIKNATNLFELYIHPGRSSTYYCAIESDGDVLTIPISLIERGYFQEKNEVRVLFLGIYYGFLILIILINIFYYFNIRDTAFLYYILFIFSIGMFLFARDGFTFKFFWPNAPQWANTAVGFFAMASIVSVMLMIKNMLNAKENFPVFNKILIYSILITSILMFAPIFSQAMYRFMISFGNILTAYTIALCLIVIIMAIRRKLYFSRYFLVAIVFLQVGGLWVIMKNSGYTGIFEFEHGMKVCSAIIILVLAYGMTVKFKNMLSKSQQEAINRLQEISIMKENANILLETKVKDRTNELVEKYEELKNLNDEISVQKEKISLHRDELQVRNMMIEQQSNHILSSIQYAKRIQDAVLPQSQAYSEILPSHFILFRPREIVSGDFYWIKQIRNIIYFAVTDCTGHGVPGGFMSMLGIAFLNDIMAKSDILSPAEILNELRYKLKNSLGNDDMEGVSKDGMEMVLIKIDTESKELTFAGAFNSIIHARKNIATESADLIRIKGDCMPIGIGINERDFTNHKLILESKDMIYLYTDGFVDQIGGTNRKKFMTKNLLKTIQDIYNKPPSVQKVMLNERLNCWMGDNEQIDDILIVGICITN